MTVAIPKCYHSERGMKGKENILETVNVIKVTD